MNESKAQVNKHKKLTVVSAFIAVIVVFGIGYAINHIFRLFGNIGEKYPSNLGSFNETGTYSLSGWAETPITLKHQSDYQKIVDEVHQTVWKEPLDNSWRLFSMRFNTDCQSFEGGFSEGEFIYFKPTWYNESIYYSARGFLVRPSKNEVIWGGDTDFPHPILGWKYVDIKKTRVDADAALQIAEENGGKDFRSSSKGQCNISVLLSHGDAGWLVIYSSHAFLEIYINPYIGKLVRVEP